ncbi:hypothetical protein EJB05_26526, partial [Eragrostis curvula]
MNDPSHVRDLSSLHIAVREIRQEDLKVLGRMPNLRDLDLEVGHEDLGIIKRFVFDDGSFPCLVRCELWGFVVPVVFQQGAMPRLTWLNFAFFPWEARKSTDSNGGFDMGLGNLPSLKIVDILLRARDSSKEEMEKAEAALKQATKIHPNRPSIHLSSALTRRGTDRRPVLRFFRSESATATSSSIATPFPLVWAIISVTSSSIGTAAALRGGDEIGYVRLGIFGGIATRLGRYTELLGGGDSGQWSDPPWLEDPPATSTATISAVRAPVGDIVNLPAPALAPG